jgi:hypothetical protein
MSEGSKNFEGPMPTGINGETSIANTTLLDVVGEGKMNTSVMSADVFDRVARL